MIPTAFDLNLILVSISVSAYILCALPSLIYLMVYYLGGYTYFKEYETRFYFFTQYDYF